MITVKQNIIDGVYDEVDERKTKKLKNEEENIEDDDDE